MQCRPVATGTTARSKSLKRNCTNDSKLASFPLTQLRAASAQKDCRIQRNSFSNRLRFNLPIQSQETIQEARWTRPHLSLASPEFAAFSQSLTAAAGSTGVGAMAWRRKQPFNVSCAALEARIGPFYLSMYSPLSFRWQKLEKWVFTPFNSMAWPLVATTNISPIGSREPGAYCTGATYAIGAYYMVEIPLDYGPGS